MLALQHLCLSCGHGYVLSSHHDGHLPERGWKVMSVWCPRLEADLGHPCSSTSSSFPVLGTGQVEAVLTACLCTADGSSLLPQTKQCWKEQSSPHQRWAQGLCGQPHFSRQGAGCGHCCLTLRRAAWQMRLVCYGGTLSWSRLEGPRWLSLGPGKASASLCRHQAPVPFRSSPSALPAGLRAGQH